MSSPAATHRRRLKVVCPHDCPDTCVMTVDVEEGRAEAIGGDPDHRFTQGFLCAKVNQYLERVYSPDRVLHPLKRTGKKGEGRFERITWDEALDTIALRFRRIAAEHGSQAILPYSYAGNMGLLSCASMDRRFFHALGASLLDRTICASAGGAGLRATVGKSMGFDPEAVVHARFVVAWGANIVSSNVHLFPVDSEALERPDLIPPGTRTLNMSQLGRILLDPDLDPPVKALFVYNSNPAAVAPEQDQVHRGLAREDLFVVVHDLFRTDTADFADIVLPATTTLEHYDIHKAYGHLYLSLSRPAIAPLGECKPNTEVFRLLARRMGLTHPCLSESDEDMARHAFKWEHPHLEGVTFERLEKEGSMRLSVGDPFVPFAEGGFPTASGKCELFADYVPPREGPTSNPERARTYPLAFISPPAHHFLNSTFSAQPSFVRREGGPSLTIHPEDAATRRIEDGAIVRTFNDRGSFLARARISDAARRGVVVGLSVWWPKTCPGGRNANAVTSQELTDMGGGATFYDALVEVEPAP